MELLRLGAMAGAAALVMTGVPTVATAGPASCDTRTNNTVNKLLECVTVDGVREHQAALQAIADANNGIRTSGTPGYDASAAYVAERLEAAGYDVSIQEFQFQTFIELSPTVLEQAAPPPADPTPGCEVADFVGFPAGDIALISRGACTFAIKATNAYNAGAAGVIIYNNAPGVLNGTLGNGFTLDIPVTTLRGTPPNCSSRCRSVSRASVAGPPTSTTSSQPWTWTREWTR